MLNHYHQGSLEDAINLLPEENAKIIGSVETESQDLQPALVQPDGLLKPIHYSWMKSFIENQPDHLIPFYLSSLPESQMDKLSQLLNIKPSSIPISPFLKAFFIRRIYHAIFDQEIIPSEYLPPSPFNSLAKWPKEELLMLIDYLGLYDLSEAIRKIVDKRYLKQIYRCLTPKKQEFLRTCLHQRERLASTRLDLNQWKGDCNELKAILHKRGLLRFAAAISLQHPHLIWHICHRLDTGRASFIAKSMEKDKAPGVVSALGQQLINLINYLKQKITE